MLDNIHITLESPTPADEERLLHHRLDGLPPGHTRYFMQKSLV